MCIFILIDVVHLSSPSGSRYPATYRGICLPARVAWLKSPALLYASIEGLATIVFGNARDWVGKRRNTPITNAHANFLGRKLLQISTIKTFFECIVYIVGKDVPQDRPSSYNLRIVFTWR